MSERVIQADGVELATEAFGTPTDPPILLVMGVMASMLWWPDEFCTRLAARGRYVIRYDNRDTGHSTNYELGRPTYTLDDLVDDTMRVLDGYGLPAAHLVGMSMGGMIAQLATLQYPTRVLSLTAISTTPVGRDNADLPGSDPALNAQSADAAAIDWTARASVIPHMVEESRLLSGTGRHFDLARTTAFVERDYDRARNFANSTNHTLLHGGERWQGRLNELHRPLLVIHGTADPLFPIAHGVTLAGAVAGSTLVRLEGGGHELHEDDWETIIAAIVGHTETARRASAG